MNLKIELINWAIAFNFLSKGNLPTLSGPMVLFFPGLDMVFCTSLVVNCYMSKAVSMDSFSNCVHMLSL